jgi:hypothetical protein
LPGRYGDARATVLKARDVLRNYGGAAETAWIEVQGKKATQAALEGALKLLQWRRPAEHLLKYERFASELIARMDCDEVALLKRSLAVETAIFYRRPYWPRKEVEDGYMIYKLWLGSDDGEVEVPCASA